MSDEPQIREAIFGPSWGWMLSPVRGNVHWVDGVEVYADDWPLRRRVLTRRWWTGRALPFLEERAQDATLVFVRLRGEDIPARRVRDLVRACNEARCEGDETWGWHGGRPGHGAGSRNPPTGHNANTWDLRRALGDPPERALLARLRRMVEAGALDGCACGCRGDFTLPELTEAV